MRSYPARPATEKRMAVDLATRTILEQMASSGARPLHESTPAEARALGKAFAEMMGPAPAMSRVEDHRITVPGGAVPVRVLVPPQGARGVIVYYHGGGWVIGDLDTHDPLCRLTCRDADVHVLSIENQVPSQNYEATIKDITGTIQPRSVRYVRMRAQNFGKLPAWHAGAGGDAAQTRDARAALRGRAGGGAGEDGEERPVPDAASRPSPHPASGPAVRASRRAGRASRPAVRTVAEAGAGPGHPAAGRTPADLPAAAVRIHPAAEADSRS